MMAEDGLGFEENVRPVAKTSKCATQHHIECLKSESPRRFGTQCYETAMDGIHSQRAPLEAALPISRSPFIKNCLFLIQGHS